MGETIWLVECFFFFFFFFSPKNINWRGGYERPYYGLSYAIMKLRHINLKRLLSIIYYSQYNWFLVCCQRTLLVYCRISKTVWRHDKTIAISRMKIFLSHISMLPLFLHLTSWSEWNEYNAINCCHVELFWEKITSYLYFHLYLKTNMAQVLKLIPHEIQRIVYPR